MSILEVNVNKMTKKLNVEQLSHYEELLVRHRSLTIRDKQYQCDVITAVSKLWSLSFTIRTSPTFHHQAQQKLAHHYSS